MPAIAMPPRRIETCRLGDEYLRHKSDSRRPGQAGSAAAMRARLMREIAGIETALALTKRVLRGADLPIRLSVRDAPEPAIWRKSFATGVEWSATAWHG